MKFNVLKLNKELEEIKSERDGLVESLKLAQKDLEDTRTHNGTLIEENHELSKKIEMLEACLSDAEQSSNAKAAKTLATLGVPEGEVKVSTEAVEPSTKELYEQFLALQKTSPSEASVFYRKHRDRFIRAFNKS